MTIDNLLFTKSGIILIVYVDGDILLSPSKARIQYSIKSLQGTFDLNNDGEVKDYLGNIFEKNKKDNPITLTQPLMVEIILELVGLNYTYENFKIHDTPV